MTVLGAHEVPCLDECRPLVEALMSAGFVFKQYDHNILNAVLWRDERNVYEKIVKGKTWTMLDLYELFKDSLTALEQHSRSRLKEQIASM